MSEFQVTAEITVSFTAEAVRIATDRAIVRVQVVEIEGDRETPINDGYCYAYAPPTEPLLDVAAKVARNPYNKMPHGTMTVWQDDKNESALRDYEIRANDYEAASYAHDNGPIDGWETVHTYLTPAAEVEVQVAEAYGAWYYRTKGATDDGVFDEAFPSRDLAVLAAKEIDG